MWICVTSADGELEAEEEVGSDKERLVPHCAASHSSESTIDEDTASTLGLNSVISTNRLFRERGEDYRLIGLDLLIVSASKMQHVLFIRLWPRTPRIRFQHFRQNPPVQLIVFGSLTIDIKPYSLASISRPTEMIS